MDAENKKEKNQRGEKNKSAENINKKKFKEKTSQATRFQIEQVQNERARIPKNTGTLKNIGKFPSLKNKTSIWFESHLERDYIHLIEFDDDVIKYREQPFKIKYSLNGNQRLYTPDFFVERQNRNQIIEVKPQSKIETEEFIAFSTFMKGFLGKEDFD